MENKKIIVALGGNAILSDDASANAQIQAIRSTCEKLADLVSGNNKLIILMGMDHKWATCFFSSKRLTVIRIQQCPLIPAWQ